MVETTKAKTKPQKVVFTPEEVIGIVIYNEEYGKTQYKNLKDVNRDAEKMRATFQLLRIPEQNTIYLKDGSYDEVDELFAEMRLKALRAQNRGIKTLFIAYYSGHGEMYGTATTHISVNDPNEAKRCYPWELNLNQISKFRNTFWLSFFDCCRL